ncbi:hypothetical protein RhiirA1_451374 [Rhizophagus irregularis]|uniref:Uncharacterized protein n=1 Tax=Rhizophagus irregularis TaxID=588596 RepID=A0A2N0SCI2_9GLOM|nr:hypothetical protein RhiirA1_451374 [Rhizophagus irregularis]GET55207.1 hypothetical protein RIR_e8740_A0A2N0SCI2_9GLOM [Rhizophagus irregularis DAOM 181602=DAOM 197198]
MNYFGSIENFTCRKRNKKKYKTKKRKKALNTNIGHIAYVFPYHCALNYFQNKLIKY